MKTVFFTLTGLTALLAATIPEAPDAPALLKRSDGYRNAWPSFVTKIKISNFETGKQDEEHMYLVYSRGSERVYVDFQSPQEKGRHLLMLGDDMARLNARPVKADLFVISGKMIKSTSFDRYQEVDGRTVIKQMTIVDDIRKNSRSVIDYLQFTPRDLPDKMFHQSRAGDL